MRLAKSVRRAILERDSYTCQYCQFPANQVDHVVPRSFMANHDSEDNLVASYGSCNNIAGSRVFSSLMEKRDYILSKRRPAIEDLINQESNEAVYAFSDPEIGGNLPTDSLRTARDLRNDS